MRGMDGGKLSEVNARTESRRQNKLVAKFKMVASDLVSIRKKVVEYTYKYYKIYDITSYQITKLFS